MHCILAPFTGARLIIPENLCEMKSNIRHFARARSAFTNCADPNKYCWLSHLAEVTWLECIQVVTTRWIMRASISKMFSTGMCFCACCHGVLLYSWHSGLWCISDSSAVESNSSNEGGLAPLLVKQPVTYRSSFNCVRSNRCTEVSLS